MDFVGKRKLWFTISLSIIIIGLLFLVFKGLNYGIDFKGGTLIELSFQENISTDNINNILSDLNLLSGTSVQQTQEGDSKGLMLRTTAIDAAQNERLFKEIKSLYPTAQQLRIESVWPTIGRELLWKAVLALIVSFIAIVLYISFRFEFKLALAAIVALLHDILIVVAFFSIAGLEVNTAFVAGLLTIVGYSINDTIVIFDRIRENEKFNRQKSTNELINASIKETLPRTVNTSITTLLCVIAILLFGGATLKTFMLTLLVGFLAGTYSSIFIASPFVVTLKKNFS